MNFNSFSFGVFLLVVLAIANGTRLSNSGRKNFLLLASYYFYMSWDWRFLGLIIFSTFLDFFLGQRIHQSSSLGAKRFFLSLSLIGNLGILGYFKYANFFIESMNDLISGVLGSDTSLPTLAVILPVGISFYTFQTLSYSLDIYKGKLEPIESLRDFATFVAFFPQLVAGPIVRASYFLPQLRTLPRRDDILGGVGLILQGLAKKILLADILAVAFVDPTFTNPGDYSPVGLLLGLYSYSFQVYLDFSAYTDIARGVSRCLGYELPLNFDRPYMATSVGNFWQRWHISMSSFMRDYLYFGLGGARSGNVYVNLMITFVVIGMWHGSGWNFIVYGAVHGSLMCIERAQRKRRQSLGLPDPVYSGWRRVWKIFLVFHIITFARILFRGGTLAGAFSYTRAMLDFSSFGVDLPAVGTTALVVAVLLHFTPRAWAGKAIDFYRAAPIPVQAASIVGMLYVFVVFSGEQAPFVYFQF